MAILRKKESEKRMPKTGTEKAETESRRPGKKKEKAKKRKRALIIREVTWPSFPSALLQTLGCIAAVAVLSSVVYLYQYAINQLITLLR